MAQGPDSSLASIFPLSQATLPRKTRGQVRKPVVICPVSRWQCGSLSAFSVSWSLEDGRGSRHTRTGFLTLQAAQLSSAEQPGSQGQPPWRKVCKAHGAAGAQGRGRGRDCRKSRGGWIQREEGVSHEGGKKKRRSRNSSIHR